MGRMSVWPMNLEGAAVDLPTSAPKSKVYFGPFEWLCEAAFAGLRLLTF